MAAYAALTSLMHIIDQLQNHPFPPISLDKQQVQSLTQNLTFLQEFLEGYNSPVGDDSDEADPLENRIADAAYAAEDVIESYIVDNIHLDEEISCISFYQDVELVIEEMDLIKKGVVEIMRERTAVQTQLSSRGGSLRSNSTAVAFDDDVLLELMYKLTGGELDCQIIPIVGMGGIGKTTLARHIYAQPLIKKHFDICAWVTISQQYDTKEIICQLLSQLNKEIKDGESEYELGLEIYQYLWHRRFLIVMDDMWSVEAWDEVGKFFPDNNNGSRVVVTTRLSSLGYQLDKDSGLKMRFLDEVSSWFLFSKIVFGEKSCPLELEGIGKKIVENCKGLPLSIVVMGGLLEKLEHTQECWEYIRTHLNSIVNLVDDEYCLKILKLSYNHLPIHLKPCFLYLGVFEEDSVIRVSTLINLWVSEGFIKPIIGKSLETIAKEYLLDLVERNLIQVQALGYNGNIKSCRIHDLLRDLCLREAQKQRFYYNTGEDINCQRRFVMPRDFSEEKFAASFESMSHARSFICRGNSRVQSFLNFRLMRILQAYDRIIMRNNDYIKFSTKPVEGSNLEVWKSISKLPRRSRLRNKEFSPEDVVKLVNLRYFVVGQDPKSGFPSSFNLLWNLHTLIVAISEEDVTAPVEIWNMPLLRHIHFKLKGVCLPDPRSSDIIVMENLQTLKVVRNLKLSEDVVDRIPNIKKLSIVSKGSSDSYLLTNLQCLPRLESFYFYCDDEITSTGHLQKLTFPHSLKKLSLVVSRSFHWDDVVEKIGSLSLLEKLVLRGGCFGTHKWETIEGHFPSLKYLELKECCDLESWIMEESSHFPVLETLCLDSLTALEEIPTEIGEIATLKAISLDWCSTSAVMSAKRIVEEQEDLQGDHLSFDVRVAVEDDELQILETPNFKVDLMHYLVIPKEDKEQSASD